MSVDTVPVPAPAAGETVKVSSSAADEAQPTSPTPQRSSNNTNTNNNQDGQFTLRALITSKEAGIIIGKAGKNVADLRETTGCRAGVSKVVPGVQERVLSVAGTLEGVVKAYSSILSNMADNPSGQTDSGSSNAGIASNITLKLLVANAIMGSLIGKGGATIQALQTKHQSKILTVKEMLPNSTDRIVSVEGPLSAVDATIAELAKIVSEQDSSRLTNQIPYQPGAHAAATSATNGGLGGNQMLGGVAAGGNFTGVGGFAAFPGGAIAAGPRYGNQNNRRQQQNNNNGVQRTAGGAAASQAVPTPSNPDLRTQNISIPSDMVGCIIGRGGSKINEIRQQSGAKISIAKDAHDESGERMFTITGSSEALEKALFLLYGQLEGEKEKRIQHQRQEVA